MKKLLLTGGHHTSALAVIDALNERGTDVQIFFVGHRYSMHGQKAESAEYLEVTSRGIPFFDLKTGKVYRTFDPREWFLVVAGFFQALTILLKVRPDLIVSFGGYLAVPVVIAGWLLGIPSVTHEQTVVSGWANRVIAKFARRVFISWPESARFFPKDKTVLTGLPLRPELVVIAKRPPPLSRRDQSLPLTVYITGGKQGAQVINRVVAGCLEGLLADFRIVHQCGPLDFRRLMERGGQLPEALRDRYLVKDYFPQGEIAGVFESADLVVGRAGAHTIYELAALGKPAILIPIPWASHQEQQRNAETLAKIGLAKILTETELTPASLLESCRELGANLEDFAKHTSDARRLIRLDAASKIATEILRLVD